MTKFMLTKTARWQSASGGDCLLLGVWQKKGKLFLTDAHKEINKATDKLLNAAIKNADFTAAAGELLPVYCPKFRHKKIVLAGLGDNRDEARKTAYRAAFGCLTKQKSAAVFFADDKHLAEMVIAAAAAFYRFQLGGHTPKQDGPSALQFVSAAKKTVLNRALAVAHGAQLARHLAEQPGNICHPTFLAEVAGAMEKSLKITVLNEKQLRAQKMNSLLAVARGSAQPPRFIIMAHRGGGKKPPIVLVGKGVTFDSGGISIKPAAAMDEMKFDMCGAAAVFGAMFAAAKMKLPLNVVGIVPACENMPGGGAMKPGDVITAMNGKTIEVLNTDAEGRLILADALCYAQKFNPAAIIDIATLTGACIIALGHCTSGLMSNDDALAKALLRAGADGNDKCWRLPLGDDYQKQLKSDYADVANIGGRAAGTITAACFLSHFVGDAKWAHLDVAGTAWTTKKRATARPLPLLMNFLMKRAGVE